MGTEAVNQLLLQLAVGRLCLSVLPPGWPGYHDRFELGATLCASWLLGMMALTLVPAWWLWALVFVVRLLLLPGALRPRHEARRARSFVWELLFLVLVGSYLRLFPNYTAIAWILGGLWVLAGRATWKRRADRRAKLLAVCGLVVPLVVTFL
ncbi:MAG: hypothetical protein ACI8X5_004015 [Planctomycetota bacterium]|jgi:hypothetical protein